MKQKTLNLVSKYLTSNKIVFNDNKPTCDFFLTNKQIRGIIGSEYGIRPRRSRIQKKYLKKLTTELLEFIIKGLKNK